MPTKIESELTHEQFAQFCERLLGLPGKRRTLAGVQALAREYGISVSPMGAKSFKDGPFARYLQKLEKARAGTEALVAAAGAGIHPLDALEEAMVLELQDAVTSGEKIDVQWVVQQLSKLRLSVSRRESARQKETDLTRKLQDSEAARTQNARRTELLEERLKLQQLDAAKAALAHVKELRAIASDSTASDAEKLERARVRLFGDGAAVPTLADLDQRKAGAA